MIHIDLHVQSFQEKHHKRKKTDQLDKGNTTKSIEQLRAERLRREKDERRRQEEVLARARGETVKPKNCRTRHG